MGTSASSKGPGGGVPMVPPWVPDVEAPPSASRTPADGDQQGEGDGQPVAAAPASPSVQPISPYAVSSPIAPAGRFNGARGRLGDFARSGDVRDLRRGLGHYVKKGYGGSGTATRRFGGTASTAGALYGALSATPGTPTGAAGREYDPALFAGRSAREIMDAIVESVRPADGTQDAEASRAAIKDALSELLAAYPEADLLNLSETEKSLAIEKFVAIDVYRRLSLDIGKTIKDKAPTTTEALARLKEVKNYIKQNVAASFRKLRAAGQSLTAARAKEFVSSALRETFLVFEGYVK